MGLRHNSQSVRRIVLPSGRSIEVVRLGAQTTPVEGLHVCPECASHLVQPVEWEEAAGGAWELMLRCPNCHWTADGIFSREQIDKLEEELDDGLAEMLADLRRLTQANMSDDIDRFVGALRHDFILPEDF
jgi:hypothetical protein